MTTGGVLARRQSKNYRASIITIAASNSRNRGQADYVCDGVADDVEIQAAINLIGTIVDSRGGEIIFLEGDYYIAAQINMNINGLKLRGTGSGIFSGPRVTWTGAAGGTMFYRTTGFRGLGMSGFFIDGAGVASVCIHIDGADGGSAHEVHLQDIEVDRYTGRGIVLGKNDLVNGGTVQLEIVTMDHMRFSGRTPGAYGLVLNAQNLEHAVLTNVVFAGPDAGSDGHINHIHQRNGGLVIIGMLSTQSGFGGPNNGTSDSDYAIFSSDSLTIIGWRSEDRHILTSPSVGNGGPCTLINVWARLTNIADPVITWNRINAGGTARPNLAIINSSIPGTLVIGPTSLRSVTLLGVEGLSVTHQDPRNSSGLEHNLLTGQIIIYGSAPEESWRNAAGAIQYRQNIGRLSAVKSISNTETEARNLRGAATFVGAATVAVTFGTNEPDTSYFVALSSNRNETFWVTTKAITGFTLNSSNAASTGTVDWVLIR